METAQPKRSVRIHRVGSVTFGCLLVVFGILFLIHLFCPALSYAMIFRLWPCIFILLGLEVLVSCRREGTAYTYDGAAIFLTMALTLFACGMAVVDYLMQYRCVLGLW